MLEGRNIIITGAASGIGLAAALSEDCGPVHERGLCKHGAGK